jgi:2-hydroxy-3-oxopropionate reductase
VTSIGFIGLGIMGKPMARNLIAAGLDLTVHNRSRATVDELAREGAEVAGSPAAVAGSSDVVITMLPDSPDVESVLLGPAGLLAHADPGSLVIDMSTISPDVTRSLGQEAQSRGVRFLDAPVSGGEAGARAGTLSIMVGGSPEDVDDARPVLSALGSTIARVGPVGAGQTVKAANQVLVAGTIALVSEAIMLLRASGIDTTEAFRVLDGGLAGSAVLRTKAEAMNRGDYTPGFRVDLHRKDLRIALDSARRLGVVTPVSAVVDQLLLAVSAAGKGDLDHGALLTVIEGLSSSTASPLGPNF